MPTEEGHMVVEVEINVVSPYSVEVNVEDEYIVTQETVNLKEKISQERKTQEKNKRKEESISTWFRTNPYWTGYRI